MSTYFDEQITGADARVFDLAEIERRPDLTLDEIIAKYGGEKIEFQRGAIEVTLLDKRSAARQRARQRKVDYPLAPDDLDEAAERAALTTAVADWQMEAIAAQDDDK